MRPLCLRRRAAAALVASLPLAASLWVGGRAFAAERPPSSATAAPGSAPQASTPVPPGALANPTGGSAPPLQPPAAELPAAALESGFRTEGAAAIDDVFGDASEYRRTIDRFLELVQRMQSARDEFARASQQILGSLARHKPSPGAASGRPRSCPTGVAQPYQQAQRIGQEYLRAGREATRHHEQVKEYNQLGETIGLTPDYRWKVRRVLVQFATLLTDYREMKLVFHDQLELELRHAACDPVQLLAAAPLGAGGATAVDAWPLPGAQGAPGVTTMVGAERASSIDGAAGRGPGAPIDRTQPGSSSVVGPPGALASSPALIGGPATAPSRGASPDWSAASTGAGGVIGGSSSTAASPGVPLQPRPEGRQGILFFIDNSRCGRPTVLYLDGAKQGEVAGGARAGFQATAGAHDLCLVEPEGRSCGAPGTMRRATLSEGWTLALRCD